MVSQRVDIKNAVKSKRRKESFFEYFKRNYEFYLLLLPGLIFMILFKYVPMYGLVIAFKDFNIFDGISKSPWVGFEQFTRLFNDPGFYQVFANTMIISFYKIVFLFPLPIILALILNEVRNVLFKRTIQTVIYLPHFLSWVIVSGLLVTVLGVTGAVNQILEPLLGEPVRFYMDKSIFRGVLVTTAGWKEIGWNSIVYIAAIASVDPELYEAARVDGAKRWQQTFHVTLPGILSTIVLMFILRLGYVLDAGFEQILVMYNPTVYDVADVISTYVYRIGLGQMNYSFGTAVGLFNSVVSLIMILGSNKLCRKLLDRSIW